MTYDRMFDKVYIDVKSSVCGRLFSWLRFESKHSTWQATNMRQSVRDTVDLSNEFRLDISLKHEWQTEEIWRTTLTRPRRP